VTREEQLEQLLKLIVPSWEFDTSSVYMDGSSNLLLRRANGKPGIIHTVHLDHELTALFKSIFDKDKLDT
jgi:hypothetical protein